MKQNRIISRLLGLGAILIFVAACSDEDIPGGGIPEETPGGVTRVALFTDGGEFEKPVTRTATADENSLQGAMPWVLVFRGDNDNAVFFEASRATGSGSKPAVTLTKTTGKSRLLIIANPPDRFFDGTADGLSFDKAGIDAALSGKTYAQAMTLLNTTKLDSPQRAVPYAGGYLPMSGSVTLNSINDQTTIGTPADKVQMNRMVAKVTIENIAPGFIIEGFTVTGAKQYGRFIQSAPAIDPGNKVDYLAPAPADAVSGIASGGDPVYIYPAAVNETSVIVKGIYNGLTGYYRLVFKDLNNNLLSIKSNKWYQFKIKDVKISGYKTPEEAMAAPPSNIMAELLVTDQSSMEITGNGQYYLGLSNSEFYVYSNTTQLNLEAVTITTNAPAGVRANVEIVSVNPVNTMSISPGNITPDGTIRGMDVKINLSSAFVTGTLKISVGNLVRTVKVERKPIMPWKETITTFSPGYVSAKVEDQGSAGSGWLALSTDGIKYAGSEVVRADNPGDIYLKVSHNGVAIARTGGVVYLARKDSQGHVKLYINQVAGIGR